MSKYSVLNTKYTKALNACAFAQRDASNDADKLAEHQQAVMMLAEIIGARDATISHLTDVITQNEADRLELATELSSANHEIEQLTREYHTLEAAMTTAVTALATKVNQLTADLDEANALIEKMGDNLGDGWWQGGVGCDKTDDPATAPIDEDDPEYMGDECCDNCMRSDRVIDHTDANGDTVCTACADAGLGDDDDENEDAEEYDEEYNGSTGDINLEFIGWRTAP